MLIWLSKGLTTSRCRTIIAKHQVWCICLENFLQSHEFKTNQKVAFKNLTFQRRSQMVNKTALDLALVGWREGEGTTLYSYTQSQLCMTYQTGPNSTPSTAKPSASKRILEQQTPAYILSLIFFQIFLKEVEHKWWKVNSSHDCKSWKHSPVFPLFCTFLER